MKQSAGDDKWQRRANIANVIVAAFSVIAVFISALALYFSNESLNLTKMAIESGSAKDSVIISYTERTTKSSIKLSEATIKSVEIDSQYLFAFKNATQISNKAYLIINAVNLTVDSTTDPKLFVIAAQIEIANIGNPRCSECCEAQLGTYNKQEYLLRLAPTERRLCLSPTSFNLWLHLMQN